MNLYRLNYGQGQVSEDLPTQAAARSAYACQVRYDRDTRQSSHGLRIERYAGDGEWIRIPNPEVP